jgi:hypothetical protein
VVDAQVLVFSPEFEFAGINVGEQRGQDDGEHPEGQSSELRHILGGAPLQRISGSLCEVGVDKNQVTAAVESSDTRLNQEHIGLRSTNAGKLAADLGEESCLGRDARCDQCETSEGSRKTKGPVHLAAISHRASLRVIHPHRRDPNEGATPETHVLLPLQWN